MIWIYVPCDIIHGQLHPIIVYRFDFGVCIVLCRLLLCVPFTDSLIEFYLIMIVVIIVDTFVAILFILNYMVRLSVLGSSDSANVHLPRCFRPGHSLNIGLNMLHSDSFVSYLDSLLGYSTWEFQTLKLIVLVAFGAVD